MSDTAKLLSTLRDIQEPLAPATASVWIIFANIIALLFLLMLYLLHRRRTHNGWRIEALMHIKKARLYNSSQGVLALAKVLRQIILKREGAGQDLLGRAWLKHLDAHFSTTWFTTGDGQLFGEALYKPHTLESTELPHLCDKLNTLVKALPTTHVTPALNHS